jgi:methyltransferase-like protein
MAWAYDQQEISLETVELGTTQEEIAKSYDDFPYQSIAFAQSHPDCLATLGILFGMQPPPVDSCRVLELGCASGGNLIPMACQFPGSRFLGTDLSRNHVREGIALIEKLGLTNIRLEHRDILTLGDEFGGFDYIICHGVFSWVPEAVRDKILAICRAYLAANGIAYISYNTYPGWHMREMVRDMMLYHVRQFDGMQQKVAQARALLDFLHQSVSAGSNPYGLYIKQELEVLRKQDDYYIAHDHLSVCNSPLYFYQFIEHVQQHGLQYLAEADFSSMLANSFPAEVATTLEQIKGNIVQREQYMDFVRNRFFRCTLLCHEEQSLERSIDPGVISRFYISAQVEAQSAILDFDSPSKDMFKGGDGKREFGVRNPIMKMALVLLNEAWPRSIRFDSLCAMAHAKLDPAQDKTMYQEFGSAERALMTDLMLCYSAKVIELHVCPSQFITEISDYPAVTPLARHQAEAGKSITNQRHEKVLVVEFARHVIRLLDGSRDRQALVHDLLALLDKGDMVMTEDGEKVADRDQARDKIEKFLDDILRQLTKRAILVA